MMLSPRNRECEYVNRDHKYWGQSETRTNHILFRTMENVVHLVASHRCKGCATELLPK